MDDKRRPSLFALNIIMALVVIVLFFTGQIGLALILLLVFAIVALRTGRRRT